MKSGNNINQGIYSRFYTYVYVADAIETCTYHFKIEFCGCAKNRKSMKISSAYVSTATVYFCLSCICSTYSTMVIVLSLTYMAIQMIDCFVIENFTGRLHTYV